MSSEFISIVYFSFFFVNCICVFLPKYSCLKVTVDNIITELYVRLRHRYETLSFLKV